MLQIYGKAFISILPYIIPMIIIMIITSFWAARIAKKKRAEAMDAMKEEIATQVAEKMKQQ